MSIEAASLVAALGGQVVGKIRLQKIVYLLDNLGLDSGFSYSYHHYGPYSAELAEAVDLENFLGDLEEEQRKRVSDGVSYSVFRTNKCIRDDDIIGDLRAEDIRRYSAIMDAYTATELELAATAYWLAHEERIENWLDELRKRKGVKTEEGRTDKALKLLEEMGLSLQN